VGFAFQLRDDVLGVFGDPEVTGKPAGDDIREGKRTVLIALAMERLDENSASNLNSLLGDRTLSPEQIGAVRSTLVECGAHDEVEKLISDYVAQGLHALDQSDFAQTTLSSLRELALGVTNRVS
jgi:geranylgeranyl diphosphate synthase type I